MTQPSLTRAIKQLEAELGGDLFRRERPAAQLTELGQRMHPLLKQCYEAAAGARSARLLVQERRDRRAADRADPFVDLSLLIPHLDQIKRQFNRLEFRFLRGNSREVGEFLKKGEAELGIAAEIDEDWDRLDTWPLFTERLPARRQRAASARRPRQTSTSRICEPSNCCRETTANMPSGWTPRFADTASTSITATKSHPSAI